MSQIITYRIGEGIKEYLKLKRTVEIRPYNYQFMQYINCCMGQTQQYSVQPGSNFFHIGDTVLQVEFAGKMCNSF